MMILQRLRLLLDLSSNKHFKVGLYLNLPLASNVVLKTLFSTVAKSENSDICYNNLPETILNRVHLLMQRMCDTMMLYM